MCGLGRIRVRGAACVEMGFGEGGPDPAKVSVGVVDLVLEPGSEREVVQQNPERLVPSEGTNSAEVAAVEGADRVGVV